MCGIGQEITVVTCARGDTCSQGAFTSIDPAEGPGGGTVVHSSDRDISADGCSGAGDKDGGGAPGGGGPPAALNGGLIGDPGPPTGAPTGAAPASGAPGYLGGGAPPGGPPYEGRGGPP